MLIDNKSGPLPTALVLLAASSLVGSALLAQTDLDASGQAAEPAMADMDEVRAFLGLKSANAEAGSLRMAAEQGDADAQIQLARSYFNGIGVPQDDTQGVRWSRLAAEQGHVDAQYALASVYFLGRGVAKDEVQAVRWRRMAAEQGYTDAQFLLGWSFHPPPSINTIGTRTGFEMAS